MKRKYKLILVIIFLVLFVTFITSSCTKKDEQTMSENSVSKTDYEIIPKTIHTESNSDVVKFRVPQILSKSNNVLSDVNELIYKQIEKYISEFTSKELFLSEETIDIELENDEYERFALNGDYVITYNNNKIISIVFSGIRNIKTEAHPNYYSFSLNIDLKSEKLIDLQSMYDFNIGFAELVNLNKGEWLIRPEQKNVKDTVIDENLLYEYLNEKNTSFYFTDSKLGVILNDFPYAIGNYITFEIPNEDINQFKKEL